MTSFDPDSEFVFNNKSFTKLSKDKDGRTKDQWYIILSASIESATQVS